MSTSEQPRSVAVIGGGPVGCELAYLFAVLGSQVTVVQRNARLIPREEPEASESMAERLTAVGVRVLLGQQVASAQRIGAGARLTLVSGDPVDTDRVVLAAGRRPRTAGLGLEALGLDVHRGEAIKVDERCRVVGTENVWAVGDVTGVAPFTHIAHYQGRVVAANLASRQVRADYRGVPRAVYTTPVLAAVGHTEASARAVGIEPLVARAAVGDTVRSTTEGSAEGWLKLLAENAGHLDLLGGSCLLLTRTALAMSLPERRRLAPGVRELAAAIADLARAPGDRPTRQRAADRALDLARSASSPGQYQPAFAAAAALQMVASDVMVFAGVDPGQAVQVLREGTGEFQVPDPPPASRSPFRSDRRRPTR